MSATPPSSSSAPAAQGSDQPTRDEGRGEGQLATETPGPAAETHNAVSDDEHTQPAIEMKDNTQDDHPELPLAPVEAPTQPQESLPGKMKGLSVSTSADAPPPLPEKDQAYLNAPKSPLPPRSPTNPSEWSEKELPNVPGDTKSGADGTNGKEDASQPEIESIMAQFRDPARGGCKEEITSPRLELAEQFLGGQPYFPPRQSSLDHLKTGESQRQGSLSEKPGSSHTHLHKHVSNDDTVTRRSSTSTVPPPPEPEPDQPFDFHRFLEQLRHRTADPVAKFLRSFLMEFGKRQWMVHEQVKIISDFLVFITNKMALCDVWREVSDSEFDNAKEGMEKLVMNRLYSQTFSPALPSPPAIPRSASRSKRRELERLHGPWRRGQHQEDIERDEVLAQKMRIYSWVKEEHLDIPPVGNQGRRFLNLAQQGECL